MKKYKQVFSEDENKKKSLYEMATVTRRDLAGLEVKVVPSDHSLTSFPNFHLFGNGYEAEFKIPDSIPIKPEEFEFLGYKKHEKDYQMKDLRKVIRWMPKVNRIFVSQTNYESIKALWIALNPEYKNNTRGIRQ
jgi:hypothetical protein